MAATDLNDITHKQGKGVYEECRACHIYKERERCVEMFAYPDYYWSSSLLFQVLKLSNNEISQIHPFAFNGLYTLKDLDISNNQLTHAPSIRSVKTTLEALNLSWNYIKYKRDTYFRFCRNIRSIDLSRNQITIIPNIQIISTTLRYFKVGHNNISDVSPLFGIHFPRLKSLVFESNKIRRFCFPPPNFIPHLHWLSLSSNTLTQIHFPLNNVERPVKIRVLLADNPWHCNGSLSWTHQCMKGLEDATMVCMGWLVIKDMLCASPQQVQGCTPQEAGKNILLHRHDNVIKWKHFPFNWPFVRGIRRSPVGSPHKGQWSGTLVFSLICAWTNNWVNNRDAGDLRRHRVHYDVNVMESTLEVPQDFVTSRPPFWVTSNPIKLHKISMKRILAHPWLCSQYCARWWTSTVRLFH